MSLSLNSVQKNTSAIISLTFLFQALTLTFNMSYITHLSTEESFESDFSRILGVDTKEKEMYLFNLSLNCTQHLNEGKVNETRTEFNKNKFNETINLSDNASLSNVIENKIWKIEDAGNSYIIKKTKEDLKVYKKFNKRYYNLEYKIERSDGDFAPQRINGIIYMYLDNMIIANFSVRLDGNLSDNKKHYMPCSIKESVPYFVNFSTGSGNVYKELCGLPEDKFDCFIDLSLEKNFSDNSTLNGSLCGHIELREKDCKNLSFKGTITGVAILSNNSNNTFNETYKLSLSIDGNISKDVFIPGLSKQEPNESDTPENNATNKDNAKNESNENSTPINDTAENSANKNNDAKDNYTNKAQLSLEGYPYDISMHWELFLVTILSTFTTALKLSDYKKYADKYKKEKYREIKNAQKKLIKKIQKIPLIDFIASLIADFHFIPACVIVILGLTAPEKFVSISTLFALVLGALIANVVSTILIIYEEVLKAKIE